jgi:DNA polymerase III subunit delta
VKYQNLKSFQKHLTNAAPHNLCRVYFVAIGDDFERSRVLDSILSCLHAQDVVRMSGNDLELRDFFDALQSPPLLGGDPILVMDEVEKVGKKQLQLIADSLSQVGAGYLLFGSRTKTAVLANAVEKEGVVLDLTDEKPWDKEKRLAEELGERAKNAGKRLAPDAATLLFDRLEKDAALLEKEIDKLICYVGERPAITREDVLSVSAMNRTSTLWQTAEEVVWEKGSVATVDSTSFHGLIPALRGQLHLGLTLATLIEAKCPYEKWGGFLPKLWPKTLEKRSSQAAELGSTYFQKGLEKLFEIELLSRNNSSQYGALIDLFRAQLSTHVR